MYNIVTKYVSTLTHDDIYKYANKNNLNLSEKECNFIYDFIKKNYKEVLKDPNKFDITAYKDKFQKENYIYIANLINKYKRLFI